MQYQPAAYESGRQPAAYESGRIYYEPLRFHMASLQNPGSPVDFVSFFNDIISILSERYKLLPNMRSRIDCKILQTEIFIAIMICCKTPSDVYAGIGEFFKIWGNKIYSLSDQGLVHFHGKFGGYYWEGFPNIIFSSLLTNIEQIPIILKYADIFSDTVENFSLKLIALYGRGNFSYSIIPLNYFINGKGNREFNHSFILIIDDIDTLYIYDPHQRDVIMTVAQYQEWELQSAPELVPRGSIIKVYGYEGISISKESMESEWIPIYSALFTNPVLTDMDINTSAHLTANYCFPHKQRSETIFQDLMEEYFPGTSDANTGGGAKNLKNQKGERIVN